MPIGDFNAVTGLAIPDEHFDTVGGWVLDLFGRVPHRGERRGRRRPGHGRDDAPEPRPPGARPPAGGARRPPAATNGTALPDADVGPGAGRDLGTTLGLVLCLLASAFFSSAEIAFLAANRVRLRHLAEQGSRVARGYMEAFQRRSGSVHRDDGGDHRPRRLLGGGDRRLPALGRRPGLALGHGDPDAADAGVRRDPPEGADPAARHRGRPPHLRSAPRGGLAPRPVVGVANLLVRAILGGWGTGSGATRSSPGPTSASSSSASRTGRPTSSRKSGR